jgi:hypothetical protein
MKRILITLIVLFTVVTNIQAQEKNEFSIDTKQLRNDMGRGALLHATSFGAYMWITDENVWLSTGLATLTVIAYSVVDNPNSWNQHLGHSIGSTVIGLSLAIPLDIKKKTLPYRILNN